MKKSRFTDSQIHSILKADKAAVKVSELFREHGISQGAFYNGVTNSSLSSIYLKSCWGARHIKNQSPCT